MAEYSKKVQVDSNSKFKYLFQQILPCIIIKIMKTISHPSPQLQSYNRALQFINFPIFLCYAVESLWITALMIAYQNINIVDCFIWIIPTIIAILIRPSLITYVHRVFSPRQAELALISHFIFGASIGCILVAVSSQYFEDHWRIVVCSFGWTIMDVSIQMVQYFSNKTKQRLQKLGYQQIQSYSQYSSIAGDVFAYSVSFIVCVWKGGKVMKRFYLCSSIMYFTAGLLVFGYWVYLYLCSYDKLILQPEIQEQGSIIKRRTIAEYFPGLYQFRRSSGFDRWLLGLHFTYLCIVDTLLIYGPLWIVWTYTELGEKQAIAYNLAMRQGSILLLIYALFMHANVLKIVFKHFSIQKSLRYFKLLLILICILSLILFMKTGHEFIFSLSGLVGMASGVYNNMIEPQVSKNYPVFQASKEIVLRIQKIFILCPMPFFFLMILQRDDVSDSLIFLPALVASLLILSRFWVDRTELQTTGNIQKIQKQL